LRYAPVETLLLIDQFGYADLLKKPEEIEVKIAVIGAPQTRALLKSHGFRILHPRVFEQNIVLDDPQGSIKARNLLLRVRSAGKHVTVTFKGKEAPGLYKRREEREFRASALDDCLAVFKGIGFEPSLRYEKYRTEFIRGTEPGHVTLDETPIGVFMELEGPARWIDHTAKDLGYSRNDYIGLSYARLFSQWCAEHGIESRNMSFKA
jgi:adenylate cyclase class 2